MVQKGIYKFITYNVNDGFDWFQLKSNCRQEDRGDCIYELLRKRAISEICDRMTMERKNKNNGGIGNLKTIFKILKTKCPRAIKQGDKKDDDKGSSHF